MRSVPDLDPALLADPDDVLERVRRASGADGRRRLHQEPQTPRPFLLREAADPASDPWDEPLAPSYERVEFSWLKRLAAYALILIVASGLGVAVAVLPH